MGWSFDRTIRCRSALASTATAFAMIRPTDAGISSHSAFTGVP
jgi:hypothetical protein